MLADPHEYYLRKSEAIAIAISRNRSITTYKQEVAGSSPTLPTNFYQQFKERQGHTLQATALVHDYLRLVDQKNPSWQNRSPFFGVAARLMRQILVDHARKSVVCWFMRPVLSHSHYNGRKPILSMVPSGAIMICHSVKPCSNSMS